jgi:hypothetical protein
MLKLIYLAKFKIPKYHSVDEKNGRFNKGIGIERFLRYLKYTGTIHVLYDDGTSREFKYIKGQYTII